MGLVGFSAAVGSTAATVAAGVGMGSAIPSSTEIGVRLFCDARWL